MNKNIIAFGAPGMEPRWTASAKEGICTAYHTSSRVWATLSHGIINEIYYPHVDRPNTRDLQFLITDGETFCHEERRHLDHKIEYPEEGALLYRLINSEPSGRYRIIKEILTNLHSSVVLIQAWLEILDETLRGKLRLFASLAPHLKGTDKTTPLGIATWPVANCFTSSARTSISRLAARPIFCAARSVTLDTATAGRI